MERQALRSQWRERFAISRRASGSHPAVADLHIGALDRSPGDTVCRFFLAGIAGVGGEGMVAVEESKSTETALDVVGGMQFDHGFVSPCFITSPDKMEVVIESEADLAA
jgi:chaperonin GroEL (HSP60 family)